SYVHYLLCFSNFESIPIQKIDPSMSQPFNFIKIQGNNYQQMYLPHSTDTLFQQLHNQDNSLDILEQ
ncbi:hypothetical protein, partial [Enterococcus faecalis]|uniref:hypothetical protein n=1 Tax=Enterococcus faecalis TaxID=1351 RepID=UPI0019D4AEEB